MIDLDLLLKLVKAMNDEGVEYITFGAMALWAHGIVRVTEDADFFVAPMPENIERLKRALRSVWDDPSIDDINVDELIGDYPSVRYGPPGTDLYMDFLTRLGEVYSFANLESEMAEIEGVPIRVVTARQLFEMKRDTVRLKDKADADALRIRFKFEEK
ncbi:MAG: nucleotidyl transferase AbiEii/AbiGii toxin family protein [Thermoanaerobaculia bacterium]